MSAHNPWKMRAACDLMPKSDSLRRKFPTTISGPAIRALTAAMFLCSAVAAAERSERIEDPAQRAKLPEFQAIPAATPAELTPTNGLPLADTMRD